MAIGTVIAIVGAIGSAAAGFAQASAAKKQAKLQEKSIAEQRKQNKNAEVRSRKKLNRERMIKAARARQQAQASGAQETSSIQGGVSSLRSQEGSATGFSTMQSNLSDNIAMFQQQSVAAGAKAAQYGALGGLFGAIGSFDFGGGQQRATVPNVSQGVA